MNHASRWRLKIAQAIAPHYAAYPNVEAVVVLGGVARGWADVYSDVDLVVYWRYPPQEQQRRAVIDHLGGQLWHFEDTFATQPVPSLRYWWEDFTLGGDARSGLKIDVGHHLSADMDAIIQAVTQDHDTHALKHEILYSIKRVYICRGAARVQAWKTAAGDCPEALARQMVETALHIPPLWTAEASVMRGDGLQYHRTMHTACVNLLKAVVYLNREYFPDLRRQACLLAELAIQPPDFDVRLNYILRDAPSTAIPALESLYDEVVALARQHMPQVTLQPDCFHHRRPVLEQPPEGWA